MGLGHDKKLADAIMSYCGQSARIDLTDYIKTIRELLSVYHYSILLIANDGGPSQFASISKVPAVILYGPETPVVYASQSEKCSSYV